MGRYIGALCFSTQIAEETLVNDLGVVRLIHAVHFESVRFVNEVEERWERVTEAHASPAAVADVKGSLKLLVQKVFVVKLRVFPV
jgi:hypothetical protein